LLFSSMVSGIALFEFNVKSIMVWGDSIFDTYNNSLELLRTLGYKVPGVRIVSCPTCSRAEIDLISLAESVVRRTKNLKSNITIAVMGCIVNGPGEAKESDVGIAGGKNRGLLFNVGLFLFTVICDVWVEKF